VTANPIQLHQFEPLWGLPNLSPFCVKLETWLRMAELPYEAHALRGPPRSKTGKLPYIERPDGTLLSDSTTIIDTLSRERGVDLDAHLSERQKAEAVLLQRTFEEHLYFLALYERWVDDAGWKRCAPEMFRSVPAPVRAIVPPIVRRKVRRDALGQGLARLDDEQRASRARADVAAVANVLGDRDYFFGEPSTIDAVAFGFLANLIRPPVAGPTHQAPREHDNLVAYEQRMRARYFPELT
jgi:glutathione S-transferase